MGCSRHEDRAGTPTIDEHNLDGGSSVHHTQSSHHPPPLHYPDMTVPPPGVHPHYPHQAYGKHWSSSPSQIGSCRFITTFSRHAWITYCGAVILEITVLVGCRVGAWEIY